MTASAEWDRHRRWSTLCLARASHDASTTPRWQSLSMHHHRRLRHQSPSPRHNLLVVAATAGLSAESVSHCKSRSDTIQSLMDSVLHFRSAQAKLDQRKWRGLRGRGDLLEFGGPPCIGPEVSFLRLDLKQATVIWSAATCRRFAFPKRHFCQSAWDNNKKFVSISGQGDRTNENRFQSQIT